MILVKNKKGFSLLEIMAAMFIFAFAVLGTLALMGSTMAFGKFSENHAIAQNEARKVMEDVREVADASGLVVVATTNFDADLTSLPDGTVAVTNLSDGDLTSGADPLPVRVRVTWSEKEATKNFIFDAQITSR